MSPKIRKKSPSTFAKRLEELRKSSHLTQEQLGLKLGLSRTTIAYYESNAKNPRLDTICKISDFFGISPEELILEKSPKKRKPGPASKLEQQIERMQLLPLSKQRMIANMLEAAMNSD